MLLSTVFIVPVLGITYPMPIRCSGEACDVFTTQGQDFHVTQHRNGTFFRFSIDNGTGPAGLGTGLTVATAPNLNGTWVLRKPIFPPSYPLVGFNPADRKNTSLWAPDVRYANGVYYLYYSMFNRNVYPGFNIRVATSTTMDDDSWKDYGPIGIPASPMFHTYASIDPNVLANFDTDPYGISTTPEIVWGSFNSALFGMRLDPQNYTRVLANPKPYPIIQDQNTTVYPGEVALFGYNRTEGAFHVQTNGFFYFFYSRGSCCGAEVEKAYVTQVCRATNASGPYFDRNNKNCAGNPDGTQNDSGTIFFQSHANSTGKYEVMAPGSISLIVSVLLQYINQTSKATRPPGVVLNFGHNYLKFDSANWPYLSETA